MCEYPHQFSGGMKQRVMIAIGLALNPRILINEKPGFGFDVRVNQNLEVARRMCDRIAVMVEILRA